MPHFFVTSRSTRLFVVLIHLAGVTYLPSDSRGPFWESSGIVGVHPHSIVLERLDPSQLPHSLLSSQTHELSHHWIQDSNDGDCLSPAGTFTQCGDSTLWNILPASQRHARRNQLIRWAIEEDEQDHRQRSDNDAVGTAYAIRAVLDDEYTLAASVSRTRTTHHSDYRNGDCLARRRRDSAIVTVPCSDNRAWNWHIDAHGVISYHSNQRRFVTSNDECIQRNGTAAILAACTSDGNNDHDHDQAVQFAVMRQSTVESFSSAHKLPVTRTQQETSSVADSVPSASPSTTYHLPSSQDAAHTASANRKPAGTTPGLKRPHASVSLHGTSSVSHSNTHSGVPRSSGIHTTRIRKHPYFDAIQDGNKWNDPQTGLQFDTDLCGYLGQSRKEHGRHTLTGVGVYTKTFFKVYAIAFYVSKRDILADPSMRQFADLDAEELRKSPALYESMRHMASFDHANGGSFDRTLMLKINMQLSPDTMRSSLEADWKMLTDEGKDLLISSSLKPRPASQTMLDIITDPANTGRCSCAQIAPPEYNANPDCCARGTELVFTWRKNSDLEARLNGDLMDTFPRPDLAAAIFFEYLRLDDPMSVNFLDRVVDGIPFLLSPLSQLRGHSLSSAAAAAASTAESIKPSAVASSHNNPLLKAIGFVSDTVSSHAVSLASTVHSGASEVHSKVAHAMSDAARHLRHDLSRLGQHLSSAISGHRHRKTTAVASISAFHNILADVEEQPEETVVSITRTTSSTQQFIVGLVHLYLLLLLIVSIPASHQKLVVKRRNSGVSFGELSDDSDSEEWWSDDDDDDDVASHCLK